MLVEQTGHTNLSTQKERKEEVLLSSIMQTIIKVLWKLVLYDLPKGGVYCCSIVILTLVEYNQQVQKNRLGEHLASDHKLGTTKASAAMLSTRPQQLLVRIS